LDNSAEPAFTSANVNCKGPIAAAARVAARKLNKKALNISSDPIRFSSRIRYLSRGETIGFLYSTSLDTERFLITPILKWLSRQDFSVRSSRNFISSVWISNQPLIIICLDYDTVKPVLRIKRNVCRCSITPVLGNGISKFLRVSSAGSRISV
jgi:hypothetical protein